MSMLPQWKIIEWQIHGHGAAKDRDDEEDEEDT